MHVWTTTLLLTLANLAVVTTQSPADIQPKVAVAPRIQGFVAPKGNDLIAKFDCRSRGSKIGEVSLLANGKYQLAKKTGKYTLTHVGYRFSNGVLRGQSIVRQQSNIYLVSTKNEARAAEVAAADGALFCTGSEIKY
jgi:hypothetical protein